MRRRRGAKFALPCSWYWEQESDYLTRLGADGTIEALRAAYPGADVVSIAGAGHMLHIERPEAVAPVIEAFLDAH